MHAGARRRWVERAAASTVVLSRRARGVRRFELASWPQKEQLQRLVQRGKTAKMRGSWPGRPGEGLRRKRSRETFAELGGERVKEALWAYHSAGWGGVPPPD